MRRVKSGKYKALKLVLLAALMAILAGCGGMGKGGGVGGGGKISGEVIDKHTEQLITGVEVAVTIGGRSTKTTNGLFELSNVPTGAQPVSATAVGYEPYQGSVNVVQGPQTVKIEMTPSFNDLEGVVYAPDGSLNGLAMGSPGLWQRFLTFIGGPVAHAQLAGESPLAGATVQAHNWLTGEVVGEPAQTDSNGQFTLKGIPAGLDIVIIVTKDGLRLSSIVPKASDDSDVVVDTVSTMVAEVLAASYKTETPVDPDVLDAVTADIFNVVSQENLATVDLRPGNGWLGSAFGEVGPILDQVRQDFVVVEGVAHAKKMVGAVRNVVPSLVLHGGPVIAEATDIMNDQVGPVLEKTIVHVGAIAELLVELDLPDPLEPGEEATLDLEGHTIRMTIADVDERADGILILSEIEVTHSDDDDLIATAELEFLVVEDQLPQWFDVVATFYEQVDEDQQELMVAGRVELEWAADGPGDLGGLRKITITDSERFGDFEVSAGFEGSGTLTADLEERIVGTDRYLVVTAMNFSGDIQVADISMEGSLDYLLDDDDYTMQGQLEITSESVNDFRVSGNITSSGKLQLEPETENNFDAYEASFDGLILVEGRQPLSVNLDVKRSGLNELSLNFEQISIFGGVEFFGTGKLVLEEDEVGYGFASGTLEVDLTDRDGYKFLLTLEFEEEASSVDGGIFDPMATKLAVFSIKHDMPWVTYMLNGQVHSEESLL